MGLLWNNCHRKWHKLVNKEDYYVLARVDLAVPQGGSPKEKVAYNVNNVPQ